MISLADADYFFISGLVLEGFIDSTQDILSGENVKLVTTADSISDEELETEVLHEEESHEGHEHASTEPHVWHPLY